MLKTNPVQHTAASHASSTRGIESVADGRTARTKDQIRAAFTTAAKTPGASILVVGYSPTGGGHTARVLNVVDMAREKKSLIPGSTVVFHVPEIWNNKKRPNQLETLSSALSKAGINVVVAQADKSVHGFLNTTTGGSDDPAILDHVARTPLRGDADKENIEDCLYYSGDKSIDWQNIPSISAKDLIKSMTDIIGKDAIKDKVKILTDMDPALQKAGKTGGISQGGENAGDQDAGIPGDNRLDQQNHTIMIRPGDDVYNTDPRNAVLAKVIGGTGELVSHIGLGDKNSLDGMEMVADMVGLTEKTSKKRALVLAGTYLLQHGRPVSHPWSTATGEPQGILRHPYLTNGHQVKNIVYVYAHVSQNRIAQHIRNALQNPDADEAYKKTLFVFCGGNALKNGVNAMSVARLGDGDAITTAGAGTMNEYAYLARKKVSDAGLMSMPIEGHNEQEKNAEAIEKEFQARVTTLTTTTDLEAHLDVFIKRQYATAEKKYEAGTLEPLLKAVADPDTYVAQAHDLLFPPSSFPRRSLEIAAARNLGRLYALSEQVMYKSEILEMNRQYIKMVFQVLGDIERKLDSKELSGALEIDMRDNVETTPATEALSAVYEAESKDELETKPDARALSESLQAGSKDEWETKPDIKTESEKLKADLKDDGPKLREVALTGPRQVKLKKKDESLRYGSLREFDEKFKTNESLKQELNSRIDLNGDVLLNLDSAREVIHLAAQWSGSTLTDTQVNILNAEIKRVKKEFGEMYTTGF